MHIYDAAGDGKKMLAELLSVLIHGRLKNGKLLWEQEADRQLADNFFYEPWTQEEMNRAFDEKDLCDSELNLPKSARYERISRIRRDIERNGETVIGILYEDLKIGNYFVFTDKGLYGLYDDYFSKASRIPYEEIQKIEIPEFINEETDQYEDGDEEDVEDDSDEDLAEDDWDEEDLEKELHISIYGFSYRCLAESDFSFQISTENIRLFLLVAAKLRGNHKIEFAAAEREKLENVVLETLGNRAIIDILS